MKFIAAITSSVILATATSLCAQEKPAVPPAAEAKAPPEATVVAEGIAAYAGVYNKADAKALAALFAEDAEWVDGEGKLRLAVPPSESFSPGSSRTARAAPWKSPPIPSGN